MLKYKKGMTLIETVVALVVAIIISVAALTVILVTEQITINTKLDYLATNECENIYNCFINSDTDEEFYGNLNFCYSENVLAAVPAVLYFDANSDIVSETDYSFKIVLSNYTINNLELTAINKDNTKTFYSVSFVK
jgi:Tfp pilus assembly protein PilV